jgi:ubiquinone/menaquinone biosynthesis C-methylase UbiE
MPVSSLAYERWTGRWSRLFVPMVIAAAGVERGDRVLDVSTGTGEAALVALRVVSRSGLVIGLDVAPEMVAAARGRLADRRFQPIVADGQALPFPDASFDAVICQLGLQFFPDPTAGLAEFHRVLRQRGAAAVCVISTADKAPMWGAIAEELARVLPAQRAVLELPFSLSDPTRLSARFTEAGFSEVAVERVVRQDTVGSVASYWAALEEGVGAIPQIYRMLGDADRHTVRQRVQTRLVQAAHGDSLSMNVEMLIACGRA